MTEPLDLAPIRSWFDRQQKRAGSIGRLTTGAQCVMLLLAEVDRLRDIQDTLEHQVHLRAGG